jgi:arginase family enzyme
MKDLSIYFSPVHLEESYKPGTIGEKIKAHTASGFPELSKPGVAIIYVPEFRGSGRHVNDHGDEMFRAYFYTLASAIDWGMELYDLGTINPGNEVKDTYFAIAQTVEELVKKKIIPLVVGGSQDLTIALYNGYAALEQMVNICTVDYKHDLGDPEDEVNADGYVSHLLLQRPCYLFNLSTIGTQAPFVPAHEADLYEKLYFDQCRLGEFNADFKKAEPLLRNADVLSLDYTSVRSSEFAGNDPCIQPNGFYADQLCQIAKYAGMSDKLTSFGIFNYFSENERSVYSSLISQTCWYFIDGVAQRKGDFPVGSKKDYTKFTVHLDDFKDEVVFYKSNKSERWWMEVPYPLQKNAMYQRHFMVPCDEDDYQRAMKNELPDLWWKTFQKLS